MRMLHLGAWGLLAAAVGGCAGDLTPAAKQMIKIAQDEYDKGEYRSAIATMDQFIQWNSTFAKAGEGFYIRGMAKEKLKDLEGARADLTKAMEMSQKASDMPLHGKAAAALGDMALNANDLPRAETL